MLKAHPRAASAAGGLLFGIVAFAFGGGTPTLVGVGLAVILGAVFAAFMYTAMVRRR
ncbi:MAG: hypothetical protein ACJ761_04200 [Chloroflexota bacterium]